MAAFIIGFVVFSAAFIALQPPAQKEIDLGGNPDNYVKPPYTKSAHYYITTPFYRVGLKHGFIYSLSTGEIPELLNYSSTVKGLVENYGLALNEIAFGPPGQTVANYVMSQYLSVVYATYSLPDGRFAIQATQHLTSQWQDIFFNNTFIFSNKTSAMEVYTTRVFEMALLLY